MNTWLHQLLKAKTKNECEIAIAKLTQLNAEEMKALRMLELKSKRTLEEELKLNQLRDDLVCEVQKTYREHKKLMLEHIIIILKKVISLQLPRPLNIIALTIAQYALTKEENKYYPPKELEDYVQKIALTVRSIETWKSKALVEDKIKQMPKKNNKPSEMINSKDYLDKLTSLSKKLEKQQKHIVDKIEALENRKYLVSCQKNCFQRKNSEENAEKYELLITYNENIKELKEKIDTEIKLIKFRRKRKLPAKDVNKDYLMNEINKLENEIINSLKPFETRSWLIRWKEKASDKIKSFFGIENSSSTKKILTTTKEKLSTFKLSFFKEPPAKKIVHDIDISLWKHRRNTI